jgi:predicted ATP-dependent endonuclease of OLD family
MILKRIVAKYFKSTKEECGLLIDNRVTIMLGANDHGKSNLLQAIYHINLDNPFIADDINWDTPESEIPNSPSVTAEFVLSADERKALSKILESTYTVIKIDDSQKPKIESSQDNIKESEKTTESSSISLYASLMESTFRITRKGVPGKLYLNDYLLNEIPSEIHDWINMNFPRFEIFTNFSGDIQDQADASSILSNSSEFIQGIFFKAGLEQGEWLESFTQNDLTMMRLDKASDILNHNLSGMWDQGKDLQFKLRHQGNTIQLVVRDPVIDNRYIRLSKKSTGVTHFFRLSMMLHARKIKNPANKYIYLFDEPGVYLHPLGQRDLQQVFELLADTSQIIIATHSLFLLNANYPERHRLVILNENGTCVDHKPYRASWRYATDALGVRIGSMALFTDRTLLVEGDSDPIYIYELIRILNLLGITDADANQLGIMSYINTPPLKYFIQLLNSDPSPSKLAILLDGDKGGSQTQENIKTICQSRNIPIIMLPSGSSIENLCLFPSELLIAIEDAIKIACEAEDKPIPSELGKKIITEYEKYKEENLHAIEESREIITLGYWFNKYTKEIVGSEASKTALARRYVEICRDKFSFPISTEDGKSIDPTIKGISNKLIEQIIEKLSLPGVKAREVVLK